MESMTFSEFKNRLLDLEGQMMRSVGCKGIKYVVLSEKDFREIRRDVKAIYYLRYNLEGKEFPEIMGIKIIRCYKDNIFEIIPEFS